MSVRQYIGARYVTKIYENTLDPSSAEWQSGVNYEPLTMVTYNYGTYLSKKQVPGSVGNPAANPTYWTQTGFYNGQIAQLFSDVANLQAEVDVLGMHKRYIFMSDSYGLHPSASDNWISRTVTKMGLSASDYYKFAEGGAGFARPGNFGHTMLTLLQDNIASIDDTNTITDLVLCAGTNDIMYISNYNETSVRTAIGNFITYVKTNLPNATVHLGMVGNFIGKNPSQYNAAYRMPFVYNTALSLNGGVYIKNSEYIMRNYTVFDDAQHPNSIGADYIANCVAAHLHGSEYNAHWSYECPLVTDGTNTIGGGNKFKVEINNDQTTVTFVGSSFTLGSSVTTPSDVSLMKYDPKKFGCPSESVMSFPILISEGLTTTIPATLTFEITDATLSDGGLIKFSALASTTTISGGAFVTGVITIPTIAF